MFSKKTLSLLLSAAIAITSAFPVFAETTDSLDFTFRFNPQYLGEKGVAHVTSDESGNGDFTYIKNIDYDFTSEWKDETINDESWGMTYNAKTINMVANSSNQYTIKVPELKANGYRMLGWMDRSWRFGDNSPNAAIGFTGTEFIISGNLAVRGLLKPGETYTFYGSKIGMVIDTEVYDDLIPVLVYDSTQSINEKFQTVSFNEGGHTVSANINVTPAYTGSKIKAGDVIEYMEVDGKKIAADDIKVKVDKNKAIGSTVEVKIQKIKGLDKATNAALKGKSLGSVTIRPIVAQQLLTSPTKTYSKEGQVYVKVKGSKAKAVYVYVPKKGKYSSSTKVKKIKLKKGTYTYNSSTPAVTFQSEIISGAAVAGK